MKYTNIKVLVDVIETVRPRLTLTLPDAPAVDRLIRSALTTDGSVLSKSRKDAAEDERGFLKLLQWNLGICSPNLGVLVGARFRFATVDAYDRAESLALTIALLSRGSSAGLTRWKEALGC